MTPLFRPKNPKKHWVPGPFLWICFHLADGYGCGFEGLPLPRDFLHGHLCLLSAGGEGETDIMAPEAAWEARTGSHSSGFRESEAALCCRESHSGWECQRQSDAQSREGIQTAGSNLIKLLPGVFSGVHSWQIAEATRKNLRPRSSRIDATTNVLQNGPFRSARQICKYINESTEESRCSSQRESGSSCATCAQLNRNSHLVWKRISWRHLETGQR